MNALSWLFLAIAIATEVGATLSLRASVTGRRLWLLPVVAGYLLSFSALSLALAFGMPLGVAYGIWTACGVALIAILGRVLFSEPFTRVMALGVLLIAAGVVLVDLGSAAHG